jgi:hypothetical protein
MILVKDFIEHLIQANHERLMLLHCWLFEKLKASYFLICAIPINGVFKLVQGSERKGHRLSFCILVARGRIDQGLGCLTLFIVALWLRHCGK